MASISHGMMGRPAVASAAILARRLLAPWTTRTAADVIRERASLAAVAELQSRSECRPLDVGALLRSTPGADSHLGYEAINKVVPLVFGWGGPASGWTGQLALDKIPSERLPSAEFATPMLTAIDHINEDVCGHPGIIHGGMTAVIVHTMASLAAALNAPPGASMDARTLNMDYRKPIRTGTFVKIHAWPFERSRNGLKTAVHIYGLQNEVLVEASADLTVAPA
ncbi:hypothetical protein LPJ61_000889 [Coemansia biformis]|uniref:Thioesterase domain-containing protein n=1 Tax=Coemansia biformis TaxID=1286918 RepID=A0A9W7YAZ6_9FUNG|nr:hypothetical protein LPJ61_000889 [Coemansia biformis]